MPTGFILASSSATRAALLRKAGLEITLRPSRIDEEAIRAALQAEGASPRDLADTLAEMKAQKISDRTPDILTIGADQVLDLKGEVFAKPAGQEEAIDHLCRLSGQTHRLHSAAVVFQSGKPLWRHVGEARLTMHPLSDSYIRDYVNRNWDSIRHSVGCYLIEEEGIRLFSRIEGSLFTIMGLPLVELLNWLRLRGDIAG